MKLFQYEKDQARVISCCLVHANLALTILLIVLVCIQGWTLSWPMCVIPIMPEYVFFLIRAILSGQLWPLGTLAFLLVHAVLPVVGWFLLEKGNFVGKKLIRISLLISAGLGIFSTIVGCTSGFFYVETFGYAFPGYVLDAVYILLLRKTVKTWKPS